MNSKINKYITYLQKQIQKLSVIDSAVYFKFTTKLSSKYWVFNIEYSITHLDVTSSMESVGKQVLLFLYKE